MEYINHNQEANTITRRSRARFYSLVCIILTTFSISPWLIYQAYASIHYVRDSAPNTESVSTLEQTELETVPLPLPTANTENLPQGAEYEKIAAEESQVSAQGTGQQPQIRYASAHIHSSLAQAAKAAGISSRITMQLAKIFSWHINFKRDIQPYDEFAVLYNTHTLPDGTERAGDIIAASITNKGKIHQALLYETPDGKKHYYTPEGKRLGSAFLRTPLKYKRISDHFSKHRKHPILKITRPHWGTDFAAPYGTPVHASADGNITFKGRKGGYGNALVIKHNNKFTTLYGHLSRFAKKLKRGAKVHRGQIIGYVGKTGIATGPHLHYELHVNGNPVNPLRYKLPTAHVISEQEMPRFKEQTQTMLAKLQSIHLASSMQPIKST